MRSPAWSISSSRTSSKASRSTGNGPRPDKGMARTTRWDSRPAHRSLPAAALSWDTWATPSATRSTRATAVSRVTRFNTSRTRRMASARGMPSLPPAARSSKQATPYFSRILRCSKRFSLPTATRPGLCPTRLRSASIPMAPWLPTVTGPRAASPMSGASRTRRWSTIATTHTTSPPRRRCRCRSSAPRCSCAALSSSRRRPKATCRPCTLITP